MTAQDEQLHDTLPPHDLHAEQAVLGSMLLSKAALDDVAQMLAADAFWRPAHQHLYDVLTRMAMLGTPVDPVTVAAELEQRGDLARLGGAPYLHTLIAAVPSSASATYYADIVLAKHKLRGLLAAAVRIEQLARNGASGADIDEVVENCRQVIDGVAQDRRGDGASVDLAEALNELLLELDAPAPPSLPTGLHDLDDALSGGLYPGQLVVIGARPGIGKSVLGLQCATHTARIGKGALFTSLEMSRGDCMRRLVASEGRVELTRLVQHTLSEDDWRRASEVYERVAGWPLHIDPRPNQTLTTIRARARDVTRTNEGLGLLVVDYLQLMGSGSRRAERRDLEIGEFTRGLKLLAKELAVPVVAISQVNRGSEQRADKRPTMSDLRESGSIEADADTVILLHREQGAPGVIEAIIAKQRQGPTKTVTLKWRGHYSRIDSMASRHLEAV